MKVHILSLLIVVLLLTGCAQENINNPTDDSAKVPATSESVSSESTREASASSQSSAEREPYYVTFEATTLDGETITSDCFSNAKLTMLNVWATYCNPCISEMPDLGELSGEYDPAEFQLIGIISDVYENDQESDTKEDAAALIEQTGANYPHLILNESLYASLVGAVKAVPTTFFVNQDGELLGYIEGAGSKENWKELIDDILSDLE